MALIPGHKSGRPVISFLPSCRKYKMLISDSKKGKWQCNKNLGNIVYLENAWTSKQMITEGEAAIPLDTTRCPFGNQSQSKQRSALVRQFEDELQF